MQTSMTRIHDPARARAYFEDKLAFTTGPVELDRWIKAGEDNLVVVDVRAAQDFAKGHIPGAINLPKEKWESLQGLSKEKTNVVYCYTQQCHLAANACLHFASRGYPVMELEGGFEAWKENELDLEEESASRFKTSGERLSSRFRSQSRDARSYCGRSDRSTVRRERHPSRSSVVRSSPVVRGEGRRTGSPTTRGRSASAAEQAGAHAQEITPARPRRFRNDRM